MSTLDEDIDTLARRIERQIRRNEATIAALPTFDVEWRQPVDPSTPDGDELFS
ncbi:hypothetical protein [Halogeometricum limi]|uniref:Uncharacterized protein n=1 Tax=Halogeometricum limi TaxID=555875 RepID=A0A1I6GJM4_9EURY|nr:hypothetical protein [Halogeometricum limi]SFR42356.1 hypothetical protein SAMN04488124_1141 [Halogeometricum limi]